VVALKNIELEVKAVKNLALISQNDAVWVVVHTRWWDLATWLWWWFCPSDKKAMVNLTLDGGVGHKVVTTKAIRVATRHCRVRGMG